MIDYILIRRNNNSKVKDCKVIPGESIAIQHRILTMDIGIQTKKRVKPRRRKQQIKWWRLKDQDRNRKCASKVEEKIKDIKDWNQLEALLLDTAKSVLGQNTGKGQERIKDIKDWNQLEALLLDTAKSVLGQTTGKGAYNKKGSRTLRIGTN